MFFATLLAASALSHAAPTAEPTRLEAVKETVGGLPQSGQPEQVDLKRDEQDRMTVDVTVGGKGPYRFLVDTGSERTVISRQLAERLKLDAGETTKLHSVIGVNAVETVFIPDLRVNSQSISVIDAPSLEASNIGADGMLGVDSLRSQRVTFDFKAGTMAISSAEKSLGRGDDDTIVVKARTRKGRLIFTDAVIDGQGVTIIVDTGSQVTIGNPALHQRLLRRRQLSHPEGVMVESVTGEKMEAQVARVERLEVGGLHIQDLAVAFADAHIFRQLGLDKKPALLLGMNAMRAFDRITIDFAERKVRFRLPGTSMRDGMRLAMLSR